MMQYFEVFLLKRCAMLYEFYSNSLPSLKDH